MVESPFIESLAAWSTLAAAVATGLSAIFIASQVFLTRRSLSATSETLEIARGEFAHAALLRTDAQRAAIDAEMPRLTVEVLKQADRVLRLNRTGTEPELFAPGLRSIGVEAAEELTTPRDNGVPLEISIAIAVSNDGPRRARVHINHSEGTEVVMLKSSASVTKWVNRVQSLEEWVGIAIERERGNPGEEREVASVTYSYPGDIGANETHRVVQGGTLVERVPGNSGGWRIKSLEPNDANPDGALKAVPMPFTRTYWASRQDNRPLEEIK